MPERPASAMPIPATPISELTCWHLEIRCSKCQRESRLRVVELAARYGGQVRIIDVLRRLRCGARAEGLRCGGIPAHVVMAETAQMSDTAHRLRDLTVWNGPEDAAA
jgi:hypothetical protein